MNSAAYVKDRTANALRTEARLIRDELYHYGDAFSFLQRRKLIKMSKELDKLATQIEGVTQPGRISFVTAV